MNARYTSLNGSRELNPTIMTATGSFDPGGKIGSRNAVFGGSGYGPQDSGPIRDVISSTRTLFPGSAARRSGHTASSAARFSDSGASPLPTAQPVEAISSALSPSSP